ncbi:unnamed protein product [Larinioides sclopetarius]|uniref:Uncharacterized protein n=1 Tax=Larinioides sclopetarius TaxID=280406 RepID=A0AAV2ACS0_9ARAC
MCTSCTCGATLARSRSRATCVATTSRRRPR